MGLGLISCMKRTIESEGFIGKSEIKIQDGVFSPEAMLSLGRLSDPQVSPDGKWIMYGVSYTDIAANKSNRNIYVCKIDGTDNHLITKSGKSISNARWSADGSKILFLMSGKLWKANFNNGKISKIKQISPDGTEIWEFKLSPDESKILYTSSIKGPVKKPSDIYSDLPKAEAYTANNLMYRHWDHWVTETPRSYFANFNWSKGITGEAIDILGKEPYELPTESFSGIEQLDWHPNSRHIAYSCRKKCGKEYAYSTNTEIYIFDTKDLTTTQLSNGGGYDTDPVWSPNGEKLAWISMERDGYEADKMRLMIASINADKIKEYSKAFKYNISGIVWGEDSKDLYFNSLTEGLQSIYKLNTEATDVELESADAFTRISGEALWFDFSSPFYIKKEEIDGNIVEKIYASYQSMDFPTELVCLNYTGEVINSETSLTRITKENDDILRQCKRHKTEQRWVETIDGKKMLTWVLFPPEFDCKKTYPAIEIFLGGPQGTLSQSWSYRWNYRLMCSQGYVVVLPNRRGTTAFGQEWCEQISGDYCGLNMQDYLSAAKMIKKEKYIGKIAGCGASYGGYSVYYMSGIHNNTFDAFIAHCGIFNQEHMYMTTEEMWFPHWDNGGAPWDENPIAKRHYENSPHKLIKNWNTPLLVIHGGSDFRVPYDQGMAAFNAAQMMGVPSKLIVFPNENHWILKPQNALYWHRSYFDWLNTWCK